MESEQYRRIEGGFRQEIQRVEINTKRTEEELEKYRDGIRSRVERNFETRRETFLDEVKQLPLRLVVTVDKSNRRFGCEGECCDLAASFGEPGEVVKKEDGTVVSIRRNPEHARWCKKHAIEAQRKLNTHNNR